MKVRKYIRDSANVDSVVKCLSRLVFRGTDICFPGEIEEIVEDIKARLQELGEMEVLREMEKGTFNMHLW